MKQILSITRKELASYFGSPMALIFVGAFLGVTLFSFFWVETFFARGIADVRPLFRSMPVLMIFLLAALTMRQWSEEEQAGTLEILLTLPVQGWQLVAGKFLAVMGLVAIALGLTLFLPLTVAMLGDLDWGPVVGGYLAAILLAAAYGAIGLFVSSRTDNPLVSLMVTVLVCGLFYLVGSGSVVDFFGGVGAILRALGAGSRFESIERGVVDLRDLVYYLSLAALFLALNTVSLDSKRWGSGDNTLQYRRRLALTVALLSVNLVLLNVWLHPLSGLRLDLTANREYSLSPPTRELLSSLNEPLLLRAYISERTHPLLAPLAPTIADMLREYEIASNGRVKAEVVDPIRDPELEAEANQTYGIRPVPFRDEGRYETSVINSYFDILVRYGDQSVVLNFQELIEVEPRRDGNVDVRLRSLEYDLTRAVKRVVFGFQSLDAVLVALEQPATLTLFVTPATLPQQLQEAPVIIEQVAGEIAAQSAGKFRFQRIDPTAANSPVSPQFLFDTYRIQPFAVSFFSPESYYLHMLLEVDEAVQVIFPSGDLSEAEVRTAIESGLKRSATGFLKVVGVWSPPETPTTDIFGQTRPPLSTYYTVRDVLQNEYEVRDVDLSLGQVPAGVDVLVVLAPKQISDLERFAIDQYLMRGGTVIVAAGNYSISLDQFTGGLALDPVVEGLAGMLAHYGVNVQQSLVMDVQNEPFPVPVMRQVGSMQVQEIRALSYPFFVDIRSDGMDRANPIVSNVQAVTLNWASPLIVTAPEERVTRLLQSSEGSWLRTNIDINPNTDLYPQYGFPIEGETGRQLLAAIVQGSFESYFADREPQVADEQAAAAALQTGRITVSPEAARLVVFGSHEFLNDVVFNISSSLNPDRYLNSLLLLQNAVDWAVEDLDLLGIRARGSHARVLQPMTERDQSFWEIANYVLALAALVGLGLIWHTRRRNEKPMLLAPLAQGEEV